MPVAHRVDFEPPATRFALPISRLTLALKRMRDGPEKTRKK
jgi:hypothetical protein